MAGAVGVIVVRIGVRLIGGIQVFWESSDGFLVWWVMCAEKTLQECRGLLVSDGLGRVGGEGGASLMNLVEPCA